MAAEGKRIGPYRVLSQLGRGAMGTVYEAVHEELGRRVALKVLPIHLALDDEAVARFHREARISSQLSHSNIVKIYDFGEAEGAWFFAMEFIEGRTLKDVIAAREPMSVEEKVRSIAQAARALAHAHERGLVHRDIKPANVMIDSAGKTLLADFGLAKLIGSESLTKSGAILGTAFYMSPEQSSLDRSVQVDHRADVYSLGVTLYELLAGSLPYRFPEEHDLIKVLRVVQESRATPLRRRDRNLPQALENVVMKAIDKDPDRRYQTVQELADDLERFLAGKRVLAPRPRRLTIYQWLGPQRTFTLVFTVAGAAFLATCWYMLKKMEDAINRQRISQLSRHRILLEDRAARARRKMESGSLHMVSGRRREALADFRSALILDPAARGAEYLLAVCHHQAGRLRKALARLDSLLERFPEHRQGRQLRSRILRELIDKERFPETRANLENMRSALAVIIARNRGAAPANAAELRRALLRVMREIPRVTVKVAGITVPDGIVMQANGVKTVQPGGAGWLYHRITTTNTRSEIYINSAATVEGKRLIDW